MNEYVQNNTFRSDNVSFLQAFVVASSGLVCVCVFVEIGSNEARVMCVIKCQQSTETSVRADRFT